MKIKKEIAPKTYTRGRLHWTKQVLNLHGRIQDFLIGGSNLQSGVRFVKFT